MRRRRIDVEIDLLHVLRVIALRPRQPEQPLLEDRVLAVPQGQRETQAALAVADPQQAVLAPAVGAAAGVVVREICPALARRRVILADGPPLALGQIGPPALPIGRPVPRLLEANVFSRHRRKYIAEVFPAAATDKTRRVPRSAKSRKAKWLRDPDADCSDEWPKTETVLTPFPCRSGRGGRRADRDCAALVARRANGGGRRSD